MNSATKLGQERISLRLVTVLLRLLNFAHAARRQRRQFLRTASSAHLLRGRVEAILPKLTPAAYRNLAVLEPLIVFTLIMLYIWKLRSAYPKLWLAILGLMLLSHLVHHETPRMLGFGTRGLQCGVRWSVLLLSTLAFVMVACGALRTIRPISIEGAALALAAYLPWGLLQQYILSGYFLNRFDAFLSPRTASLVAATLFCIAHTPNWFLMFITFLGGYWSTRVYRNCRCLYFLGLAHAISGFLLLVLIPDSLTHHLRVGPAWFKW